MLYIPLPLSPSMSILLQRYHAVSPETFKNWRCYAWESVRLKMQDIACNLIVLKAAPSLHTPMLESLPFYVFNMQSIFEPFLECFLLWKFRISLSSVHIAECVTTKPCGHEK